MRSVDFTEATQYLGEPPGWDTTIHGPCHTLPVCPHHDGSKESRWQPTKRELEALNNGGVVTVHIVGGQPAIMLGVI